MLYRNNKKGVYIVEFDYSKLKGRIVEKLGTQSKLAELLHISNNALSRKLNNFISFSAEDIMKIISILEIDVNDIGIYFYTLKV